MSNVIPKLINDVTPNAPGTAIGSTIYGLDKFISIDVTAQLVGATGGTLDVYLQTSPDNGVTWVDFAHYAQLAAGAAAIKNRWYATRYGSMPTPVLTGIGTLAAPGVALAANTFIGGEFGDRIRAIYVAGALTTAGAVIRFNISGTQLT